MIRLEKLYKTYGSLEVLKDITGEVSQGEVVAIIGPSGSGKSTLLRSINLLDPPTQGAIYLKGACITQGALSVEEVRTRIGMVFQHFNLFPHMTVLENIIYAPQKVKGITKKEAQFIGRTLLKQVGLLDKEKAYPSSLSGGQKQRVSIARALAMTPEVMLFDEPTSALDPEMVKEVLGVMQRLANTGMTMMLVTHEITFAREVADQIWFIDEGRLLEKSPSETFFKDPKTTRAREFLSKLIL